MKKVIGWSALIIAVLTACGTEEPESVEVPHDIEEDVEEVSAEAEVEEGQAIEVDKGLLSVEITIPPTMINEENVEETIAKAKEDGVSEVSQNEDGSLTYKLTKSAHAEMLAGMKAELQATLEELKNSEDFPTIREVIPNNSFSEYTVKVDQEAYQKSFDGFALLGLAFAGLYYQLFSGDDPDKFQVTVNLENVETGEVFNTIVYPDALEE